MARTPVKAVLDDIVDRGQAQRDKASAALEEALAAGKRGTEALTQIVRREVERQLRALGLRPAPAKKTAAKKATAKKPAAKKSTAKKTAAQEDDREEDRGQEVDGQEVRGEEDGEEDREDVPSRGQEDRDRRLRCAAGSTPSSCDAVWPAAAPMPSTQCSKGGSPSPAHRPTTRRVRFPTPTRSSGRASRVPTCRTAGSSSPRRSMPSCSIRSAVGGSTPARVDGWLH